MAWCVILARKYFQKSFENLGLGFTDQVKSMKMKKMSAHDTSSKNCTDTSDRKNTTLYSRSKKYLIKVPNNQLFKLD